MLVQSTIQFVLYVCASYKEQVDINFFNLLVNSDILTFFRYQPHSIVSRQLKYLFNKQSVLYLHLFSTSKFLLFFFWQPELVRRVEKDLLNIMAGGATENVDILNNLSFFQFHLCFKLITILSYETCTHPHLNLRQELIIWLI